MVWGFSDNTPVISIHALLAESDNADIDGAAAILGFLSTLSLRRATLFTIGLNRAHGISIHALLAESDAAIFFLYCAFPYFYPRSPCGERRFHFNAGQHICVISIHALLAESDLNFHHRRPCCFQFLSTLSLRRATCARVWQH